MRSAFYSPYLDSFGGGERYLATAAQFLSQKGQTVIFWNDIKILPELESRFNLDLDNVEIEKNIFDKHFWQRWQILKDFDLVFVLSDGSVPFPFAGKNILHFQEPFKIAGRSFKNWLKLKKYIVVCNSNFTKKYIDQSFGVNSFVIYPPVDVNFFTSSNKEKIILSVGRFLPSGQGKKQEVLIDAFRSLVINHQSSIISDWRLYLAGGVADKKYFENLKEIAKNLPVKFFPDNNAQQLKRLYSQASIYWHAKGFGEDLDKNPQYAEHFGISIVEAQSAGCVPLVFNAGGVAEIIEDGVNGFFWRTLPELIEKTRNLISNPNLLRKIQKEAIATSNRFSKENFFKNLEGMISPL